MQSLKLFIVFLLCVCSMLSHSNRSHQGVGIAESEERAILFALCDLMTKRQLAKVSSKNSRSTKKMLNETLVEGVEISCMEQVITSNSVLEKQRTLRLIVELPNGNMRIYKYSAIFEEEVKIQESFQVLSEGMEYFDYKDYLKRKNINLITERKVVNQKQLLYTVRASKR